MIILDFGSGETCQNSTSEVKRMIDALAAVDPDRQAVIKWQLFTHVSTAPVKPLLHDIFDFAYYYAAMNGYGTTASVFDMDSLDFLLKYEVPFIKIAARRNRYWLIKHIPRGIPVMVSVDTPALIEPLRAKYSDYNLIHLCCVPEYPARQITYEWMFGRNLSYGISDHTEGLELYYHFEPWFYEKHYKLEDSTGLDAGPFAATPEELEAILE